MKMNPIKLMQMKSEMSKFENRHPKLSKFIQMVEKKGLVEGAVIEMKVLTPSGERFITNVKLSEEDVRLLKEVEKELHKKK